MKLGPWKLALQRHVIPRLPGSWYISRSGFLVRRPADWLMCAVSPEEGFSFRVHAQVQLLTTGREYPVLDNSVQFGPLGPAPRTVEDVDPFGERLWPMVEADALPLFDRYGTVDGYLSYLEGRVAALAERIGGGWQDINVDEELFCVHVLRGDRDAALAAAEWAERAAKAERRVDWVRAARDRVRTAAEAARRSLDEAVAVLAARAATPRPWLEEA